MPVLAFEQNVYPLNLFDDSSPETTEGRSWWVLHTKPRQEKAVLRHLLDARIPCYLPLLRRKNLVRRRVTESHIPLFTSYVFLFGTGQERVSSLASNRVVRTLEVYQQDRFWTDLNQVHRLLSSGLPVTPEDRLCAGATVEIRCGPLAGLKGKIVREAGRERFIVQVDFIEKGASVTLDAFTLAAVPA